MIQIKYALIKIRPTDLSKVVGCGSRRLNGLPKFVASATTVVRKAARWVVVIAEDERLQAGRVDDTREDAYLWSGFVACCLNQCEIFAKLLERI